MDSSEVASGGVAGLRAPEDSVVVVDAGGAIVVWSAGARHLLGYEPDEIVGRPAADLLAADLPKSARHHIADGHSWSSEVALRHRDGGRLLVQLRGTPLMDAARGRLWLVSGAALAHPAGPADPGAAGLWDLTLAQLPVPVAIYDREARFVAANESMTRTMGKTEEEMRGLTLWQMEPYWPFDEYDRLQRQVLRTGEMVFHEELAQAPGEAREHAWSMFISPLKDQTGTVRGLSATVFDTTEQYWARRRLAVLNDATLRIGTTLDVTRTAEELAEVAVTGFADFVVVDLLESVARGDEPEAVPPGQPVTVRRTAQASVLAGCPESVVPSGEASRYPAGTPPAQALVRGEGAVHRQGDRGLRKWIESSPARVQTVDRYMIHSVMMVPLRARGVTLGLVHFLRHRTGEPFSEDDLLLAEEIVARAAVSVDNARRFTRERRTALALQRSLPVAGHTREGPQQSLLGREHHDSRGIVHAFHHRQHKAHELAVITRVTNSADCRDQDVTTSQGLQRPGIGVCGEITQGIPCYRLEDLCWDLSHGVSPLLYAPGLPLASCFYPRSARSCAATDPLTKSGADGGHVGEAHTAGFWRLRSAGSRRRCGRARSNSFDTASTNPCPAQWMRRVSSASSARRATCSSVSSRSGCESTCT